MDRRKTCNALRDNFAHWLVFLLQYSPFVPLPIVFGANGLPHFAPFPSSTLIFVRGRERERGREIVYQHKWCSHWVSAHRAFECCQFTLLALIDHLYRDKNKIQSFRCRNWDTYHYLLTRERNEKKAGDGELCKEQSQDQLWWLRFFFAILLFSLLRLLQWR